MDLRPKFENINKALEKANLSDAKKTYQGFLKRLPDISHLKNIVLFSGIACIAILLMFGQRFASLYEYLPKKPLAGGTYTEGVVGKIEQFNPLFTPTNSAEQAVSKLIFSGLVKENGSRTVDPDIAEGWTVSEDKKSYVFALKNNVLWHDGEKLTADDVAFTINTMQNPDARSTYLSIWKGAAANVLDETHVKITLPNSYVSFINECDFPILPKHLLENVQARNLKVSEFSQNPIGSGPFTFQNIKSIRESQEVVLKRNDMYYGKIPFLDTVMIKTYASDIALADGYKKREVSGVEKVPFLPEDEIKKFPDMESRETALPAYDVLYFNLRSGATKEKALREAISLAVDRDKIVKEVYEDEAEKIYSPILPGYAGYQAMTKTNLNLAEARKKLTDNGFQLGEDGIFKKGDVRAAVKLVTTDEQKLSEEAEIIATNLGLVGIETKVEKLPMGALVQDKVRPRVFDLLLISQNAGSDTDLYPFWDSTQMNDPGLNFSGFSDRRVDKYLEQARVSFDDNFRAERYKNVTDLILAETPAVFLARPNYRVGISSEIKGVNIGRITETANRFWDIANWYIVDERAD